MSFVDLSYYLRDAIMSRDATEASQLVGFIDRKVRYPWRVTDSDYALSELDLITNGEGEVFEQLNRLVATRDHRLVNINHVQSMTQLLEGSSLAYTYRMREDLIDILAYYIDPRIREDKHNLIKEMLALDLVMDMMAQAVEGYLPTIAELDDIYDRFSQEVSVYWLEEYNFFHSPTGPSGVRGILLEMASAIKDSKLLAFWFHEAYGTPLPVIAYQPNIELGPLTVGVGQYAPLSTLAIQARKVPQLQPTLSAALMLHLKEALVQASSSPSLFLEMYKRDILSPADAKIMVIASILGHSPRMLTALAMEIVPINYIDAMARGIDNEDLTSKIDLLITSDFWLGRSCPESSLLLAHLPPLPTYNKNNSWDQLVEAISYSFLDQKAILQRLDEILESYLAADLDSEFEDNLLSWVVEQLDMREEEGEEEDELGLELGLEEYFRNAIPYQRLEQLIALHQELGVPL